MPRFFYVSLPLAACILFGGCAPTKYLWVKADSPPEAEQQDSRQCRAETERQGDYAFEQCMLGKGYRMKQRTGWQIRPSQ